MSKIRLNRVTSIATRYEGRILLLTSIGWMTFLFGRTILSPLLPMITDSMEITNSEAGFAFTVLFGFYSLAHYPGGRLSDQWTRKVPLVAGLCSIILGFGLLTLSGSYPLFLISVSVIGVGGGFYFVSVRALLSDLFTSRRGQAFGVNYSFGMIGNLLAAGLSAVFISLSVWKLAYLPTVVVLVCIVAGFHYWDGKPYEISKVEWNVVPTFARLFRVSKLRLLVVAYSLYVFSWVGVVAFVPTYLQVSEGMPPLLASLGFSLLFVTGMFVSPVAGYFSDSVNPILIASICLLVSSLGASALVVSNSTVGNFASIVLLASGLTGFPAVMQSYLVTVLPSVSLGGDFGAFKTVYSGIGSLGSAYIGFLSTSYGYATAFGGIAVLLLTSTFILQWLDRS